MAAKVTPLPLTADEKNIVQKYLKEFNSWNDLKYDDDPLNAFKTTEYLCMCNRLKESFTQLYQQIPQIVKDEFLVPRPEYPHRPSWSRVLEVVW